MPSFGIEYRLVGPDGTEAVFNNPESPNFVGYLNSENGITGLLDTPDVREGYFDKPEFDGGVQTNSFFSKRVGVIQGFVIPDPNMATYNRRESRIKAASRGMEAEHPSLLYFQPEGRPPMVMRVYRQGKVSFTGRRPKIFLIPLSSPDPYMFAAGVSEVNLFPHVSAAGDHGFSSPFGPKLETSYEEVPPLGAVNEGDAPTWPEFIFTGPMTNPIVLNTNTEEKIQLSYTLGVGEKLIVDSFLRTVMLQPFPEVKLFNNRYSAYATNFLSNKWFPLVPGNNNLQTAVSGTTNSETSIIVKWQSAWE